MCLPAGSRKALLPSLSLISLPSVPTHTHTRAAAAHLVSLLNVKWLLHLLLPRRRCRTDARRKRQLPFFFFSGSLLLFFFVHHPSFECEITGIVAKHWHETGITYITLGLVCLLALLPVGSRRERNTLTRAEGWCTGWCCDWSVMERHVSWVTAGWFDFSIWFGWERRRTDGGKKRKGGRLVKKQGKFRQSISGKTSQKYTRVYSKQKLSC